MKIIPFSAAYKQQLIDLVAELCIKANRILPDHQIELLKKAKEKDLPSFLCGLVQIL